MSGARTRPRCTARLGGGYMLPCDSYGVASDRAQHARELSSCRDCGGGTEARPAKVFARYRVSRRGVFENAGAPTLARLGIVEPPSVGTKTAVETAVDGSVF